MCAVRDAGSCTGVVTVLLPVLRARRRPLAPTGSLTESASCTSSREELPSLTAREAKRAVLGLGRKSRAAGGTRRTSAPTAIPRWCPTLKPPVLGNNNESRLTRIMLGRGNKKVAGRPAGPACVSLTRRAAANYLRGADGQVINCAREEEALRRKV